MKKYLNKFLLLLIILILAIPNLLLNDIVTAQGLGSDVEDTQEVDEVRSVTLKEKVSGLKMKVPDNLNVDGFENGNPDKIVINWQKIINLTPGESIVVSVWNRENKAEIQSIYKEILKRDQCTNYIPSEYCITGFPLQQGKYATYSKYFLYNKKLIRVIYSFVHLYKVKEFKSIANTIKINDEKVFTKKDFKLLNEHKQNEPGTATRVDSCGGFYDPGNPTICCSSGWDPKGDYNNANCTWYALYKRPDLRGRVYGDAGNWYNAAELSGLQRSNSPTKGAIAVWSGHVAYIESVSGGNMTWSEQNCYTYWLDGTVKKYGVAAYNPSVTRPINSNYGGTLYGYIPVQNSSGGCSGTNQVLSNFNSSGPLTCRPSGSLTIKPESSLNSTNGEINILI